MASVAHALPNPTDLTTFISGDGAPGTPLSPAEISAFRARKNVTMDSTSIQGRALTEDQVFADAPYSQHLEVEWQFATETSQSGGACGEGPCISQEPSYHVFITYYTGWDQSTPVCTATYDITTAQQSGTLASTSYSACWGLVSVGFGSNSISGTVTTTGCMSGGCWTASSPPHDSNPGVINFARTYWWHGATGSGESCTTHSGAPSVCSCSSNCGPY
ncbi:hypothetical protein GYMLUDRAFT_76113 [Collybiopsis luxurians FD-317 M1]|uniref:Uncharacterized protein n=1 Tax=Collybiopsis luxurians FD-317 M1 TaxID=944289 RepID=A0A0D0BN11_9AGAR|nr:hypothetical protein GYMLUDRAFT_76113 [Collybiopsis luxurians FD-317 M1]